MRTVNQPAAVDLPAMFRLDGRVALVTGAGRGIGAGVAEALARAGAEVVLVARTAADLHAVACRIKAAGGRAQVCACDVTDSAAIRAAIDALPRLDIAVNNAGSNIPEPFIEVGDAHLDELIALNVRAAYVVAQAATRKMLQHPQRRERGGVLVNMSSQMGHVGAPNRSVYCMTKHAVEGLTKALAVELAPLGIRAVAVGPTFVDTQLIRRIVGTTDMQRCVLSNIPLGRMASVAEIAAAVLYLASPAAAMVTGSCLRVDGGWTAQ